MLAPSLKVWDECQVVRLARFAYSTALDQGINVPSLWRVIIKARQPDLDSPGILTPSFGKTGCPTQVLCLAVSLPDGFVVCMSRDDLTRGQLTW